MSNSSPTEPSPLASLPLPPGQLGLPVIGETLNFLFDPEFANKRQAKYGNVFKTSLLGRPTIVMVGPEANQCILSTHMEHFSWREGWPGTFKELLGESLFLQEGEQHRRNRKLLMPAFHGKALEGYLETMIRLTQPYLQRWQRLSTFTWLPEFKQLTFDIASTLLLGTVPGSETTQLSTWFSQLTNGLFAIPLRWPGTTYAKALQARNHLLAHLETVIVARQASPSQDALGLLVQSVDENGDRLSLTELKVQALLMLFAGHETTTSMLTCLAMALAQHPEIEQRCRQEQAALVAEGPLCMAQLRQMPYLEQVLKEVERLYPPVGGGFRGVVKPLAFQGYQIPAGWQALYRIDATHRDPRCFADPLTFDPDRFSPERAEHRQFEFNLVGFGGGPRICLGLAFAQMELKIVAALLLRHYAWELLPGQDLTTMAIPTLRPKSGLKVRFAQLNAA